MGSVFRARDLLSGSIVALKRVSVPADEWLPDSDGSKEQYLTLAQEYQALATLRHPHIISVYDFGFDQSRRPYFTMEYIEGGCDIVEYGEALPLNSKINLLVQMLQALVYLHRRGIIHRDLKPANAVVIDGKVRVLDFGVSVTTQQTVEHITHSTAGTMAYLAPEIFKNEPYSRASDLYAFGVIAFQLLTGAFPYTTFSLAVLLHDILEKQVDTTRYGLRPEIADVLNRLLAKERQKRYDDAQIVIQDLCRASELPTPPESIELRESFLQAAKFVGRKEEMAQLSSRLDDMQASRGSALLVGGESGVGKTRLLDELRIRALVEGVLVLRGQAAYTGPRPFEMWRHVLHSLSLYASLSPEELLLFRSAIPDVEWPALRESQDRTPLTPKESQERLCRAVSDILQRTGRPVLIILEDLQWAGSESLGLMNGLMSTVSNKPLFITGSFRDDRPLPASINLDLAEVMTLHRLDREGIAAFSQSMLGSAGKKPEIVQLLEDQTEGNAFFLVEVVRALAEEAGELDKVGIMTLPKSIMTGGIQAIIDRRLARVPEEAQPLMRLASVAARVLDLDLLRLLDPAVNLEKWLTMLMDVAVIEPYGDTWWFSHDKLREAIKDSMPHELHHELHHRVAAGMEALYPDMPEKAGALSLHWMIAGDRLRQLHYAEIAGRQAAANNANTEAVKFYKRALAALETLPESPERDERELALRKALSPLVETRNAS